MKSISKNYLIFSFVIGLILLFFSFGVVKAGLDYEVYRINTDFQIKQTANSEAPIKQLDIGSVADSIRNTLPAQFCACNVEGENGRYAITELSQKREDCRTATVFEPPTSGGLLTNCSANSDGSSCLCDTNIISPLTNSESRAAVELTRLRVESIGGALLSLTDSRCSTELNNTQFSSCRNSGAINACTCISSETNRVLESVTEDITLLGFSPGSSSCNDTYILKDKPKVSVNNCEWTGLDVSPKTPTQSFTQNNLSEIEAILNKPQLQIKIPGLSFSGEGLKAVEDDMGAKYFVVPFLGEYISAVYKFAVAAGSIFAVIMIIVAGLQWMIPGNITSSGGGDSKETINKAKKRITGAVIGLILLVGSYTLLYTINPNLVEFHGLRVQFVEGVDYIEYGQANPDARLGEDLYSNVLPGPLEGDPNLLSVNCAEEPDKPASAGVNASLLGKLSCSAGKKRDLKDVKYVIIHDGGSAKKNVEYWLKQFVKKGKTISSHYTINRSGSIYQLVDESRVAFHTPNWNSRTIGIDMQADPSANSFYKYSGISTCLNYHKNGKVTYKGKTYTTEKKDKKTAIAECTPTFTQAQYNSLNALLAGIVSRTSVTIDNNSILGHCNSAGNHSDPRNFDWSKINLTEKESSSCKFFPVYGNRVKELADKLYGF